MAAKRPKLCCAEAAGMGACAEPQREDSYFCERHDQQWMTRPAASAHSEAVA